MSVIGLSDISQKFGIIVINLICTYNQITSTYLLVGGHMYGMSQKNVSYHSIAVV